MNLAEQTRYLIKKTGLFPDKLKGQNFCIDENVLNKMVKTGEVKKGDCILEVGPGFGFLTQKLVKTAGRVLAVELDNILFKNLKNLTEVNKNLEVVSGDILKFNPTDYPFLAEGYKIVANLPYGISSAFLKKFLTAKVKPKSITLLLQYEVAKRLCAQPGQMSLLAVSVQLYAQPQIISPVPPESFMPKPKVNSAIVKISDLKIFPFANKVSEKIFWQVVRSGFSGKRKTLENNLSNSLHLSKNTVKQVLESLKINPKIRPQELAVNDWLKVALGLKDFID